jgi:hypothetical protein
MLSLFHTSAQCWNLVVQDYGVIPTIAAATTFAVLLFLSFCVLRTLAPRGSANGKTPHPHPPEKKKKKRKGQARHRGGGAGAATNNGARIKSPPQPSIPEQSPPPDVTPWTPMSSSAQTVVVNPTVPCPEMKELPEATSVSIPLCSSPGKPYEKERRSRVPSVSSLDTTALSDDQSSESTSVRSIRSIPSVSVSSSRSYGDQEAQLQQSNKKSNTPSNRRNKKNGKGKPPKVVAAADAPLVASSRWDALKPKSPSSHNHVLSSSRTKSPNHHPGSQQQQQHGHYNNHGTSNNNNNNNNHHNNSKHHGRGGVRNNRKGGGRHHNSNNHQQSSAAANTFFSKNAPAARSKSPVQSNNNTLPRPRSPVSPPLLVSKRMDGQLLVSNPIPPPPPGLGPLPSAMSSLGAVAAVPGGMTRMSYNNNNNTTIASGATMFGNQYAANHVATSPEDPFKYVSHSFLTSNAQLSSHFGSSNNNSDAAQNFSLPRQNRVKENPFAPDDSQIEADLQELGGQMAGSILDF